jgi:Cu+-exporting ATPase
MSAVTDPVCGMSVDPATAEASHRHDGTTFHFCCPGCRDRFAADPARYLAGGAGPGHPATPHRPLATALPAREQGTRPAPGGAARFTCPMHPEVVRDRPGPCPLCGMALEPMEVPFVPGATEAPGGEGAASDELTDMRRRFVEAAILALPLLLLSMGGMLPGVGGHLALPGRLNGLVQMALATPIVFHAGWPLLARGGVSILTRRLNMFTLIALGVLTAWGASAVVVAFPGLLPAAAAGRHDEPPLYFESAAVITALVLLGQVLELRARGRARDAVRALAALLPRTVARRRPDGRLEEVPIGAIRPGDLLVVRPGAQVPADGEVLEGESAIDEALLTGESMPVARHPGDPVVGGSVNGRGALVVRATRVGGETLLAGIARQVTEAQRSRAPIQRLADQVSAWFVPLVIGAAVATFAVWAGVGPEPRLAHAILAAVSVLIIACPCALGLATPMSILIAAARGATAGVLVRDAAALENLARAEVLVIDKTGTLTEGRPRVTDIRAVGGHDAAGAADRLLSDAAAVEALSEHPLAGAILAEAAARGITIPAARDFVSEPGGGARAVVAGRLVAIGTARFAFGSAAIPDDLSVAIGPLEAAGRTVAFVAVDSRPAGFVAVADPLRPGAAAAVAALRADGLDLVLATGDREAAALAVAGQVGIGSVHAAIDPAGKRALVESLRRAGRHVAMAGDGVNDAPALAAADSGIALGSGTDVAIGTAGLTLVRGDLAALGRARRLSRATLRNIRQNLAFAFGYNALCVPVAAGVFYPFLGWTLSPMLAAAAMSLSSVTVIANALRLRRLRL